MKSVILEEKIVKSIRCKDRPNETDGTFGGILIGARYGDEAHVYHAVRCDLEAEGPHNMVAKCDLMNLSDKIFVPNARQIQRVCCGGIDILGIYFSGPSAALQIGEAKFRKILFSTYKSLLREWPWWSSICVESGLNRAVLLFHNTSLNQFSGKAFDFLDYKTGGSKCDVTIQSLLNDLQTTDSDIHFTFSLQDSDFTQPHLADRIQAVVFQFSDIVWNSEFLIKGCSFSEQQNFSSALKPPSDDDGTLHLNGSPIELLSPLDLSTGVALDTELSEPLLFGRTSTTSVGCVRCRICLNSKATCGDAIKALKLDAIRSFTFRCRLLCEDADVIEENSSQQDYAVYETPRRVFGRVNSTGLFFSDYIIEGETLADFIERSREILDVDFDNNRVELDCEHLPGFAQ